MVRRIEDLIVAGAALVKTQPDGSYKVGTAGFNRYDNALEHACIQAAREDAGDPDLRESNPQEADAAGQIDDGRVRDALAEIRAEREAARVAIEQLREDFEELQDTSRKWRDLALQFDGHRMEAMGILRALANGIEISTEEIKAFVAAEPLSGEEVLRQRIAEIAAAERASEQDQEQEPEHG